MKGRKVIPQLDRGTPAYKARERRRAEFERFCRQERWTPEHKLQALSAVLFHTGSTDRDFAVNWLEELLEDLRTKTDMESN